MTVKSKLDDVMNLAMKRGFFFPSSELYSDSPSGFFDYGPNGVALKNKIIEHWRKRLKKDNALEIDGSQIMSKNVFTASGHLTSFTDPLVKCEKCKSIYRADKLVEEKTGKATPEKLNIEDYDKLIEKYKISCTKCKSRLSKTARWNMMFKVGIGPEEKDAFLRPETCQSIFVDFPRLYQTMRVKFPQAIAQLGKSFRNEISPRQALLRMREFNQAEIEVFFNPNRTDIEKFNKIKKTKLRLMTGSKIQDVSAEDAVKKKIISSQLIAYYLAWIQEFYESLGIDKEKIRLRKLTDEERAFYAKEAWDLEIETSLGWIEMVACNNRGEHDLKGHAKQSGKSLEVMDNDEKTLPNIFELSMGIDRTLYALLDLAFEKEMVNKEARVILKLTSNIAPTYVAIFPLVNKDGLPEVAEQVYTKLSEEFDADYDYSGSIGKMYRRHDEIGTPFCITIDHQTLKDKTVTVRYRDTMKQTRVKIDKLSEELKKKAK
jgi:glycyl-tRNA synthetase